MNQVTLTASQRMWGELGAMLVGSALVLRAVCLPLMGRVTTLRAQLHAVEAQMADGAMMAQQAATHEALLVQAQEQYRVLTQRVGAEASLARVLDTFKLQAQGHRVELVAVQPRAAEAAPRVVTLGEGMRLREVPLTLQLTGRYRHLGEFLALLADEPFPVAVRSLHMSTVEGRRTQLHAELLLAVYLTDAK